MNLFISTKNNTVKISPINDFFIHGWNEYKMNYDLIKIQKLEKNNSNTNINKIFLMHFTHINNIWHLIHHLFICYKFMKKNKLNTDFMYPIFFNNFFERQCNICEANYKDLMFDGMGFNYEKFKKLYNIFSENKSIYVKNLMICHNEPLNFRNEPLIEEFKNYILKNFNVKREQSNEKKILFILRRGTREITNIDFVKKELNNYIKYVYLEDYSIKEQIQMYANADIVIGVHGAGLAWCVFMKKGSKLVEMYPGNSNTDNYIRWCNIAYVNYKRLIINITSGDVKDFRNCKVNLNKEHIDILKNVIKI